MPRLPIAPIFLFLLIFKGASPAFAQRRPVIYDAGGVLKGLSIAAFPGSNLNSIQATAADSKGNIYVTGTVNPGNFLVKNAVQPNFGDARILRTADLGATWTAVGSPQDEVNIVVPDPVAPEVLFAGGQTGIYKTTDSGQTWRLVYTFSGRSFTGTLTIDSGNHERLAAIDPSGNVVRSLDGGETWTTGGQAGGRLIADPGGSGALLGISTGRLYISRDWGATFQPVASPGPGSPSAAAFDPSHPGWIYADVGGGTVGSLYLSTDYGSTWMPKASPPTTFSMMLNLEVDQDDPNTLVASTADGLYRSADGAASWTRQPGQGPFSPEGRFPFAIVRHSCAPAGRIFALGSGVAAHSFQIDFSPDYGATWNTPQLTRVSSVATGPGCTAYATRQQSTDAFVTKLAPDGGVLWSTFLGGSDEDAPVALAVDSEGNAYVAGNTISPDFPSTAPRIGVPAAKAVFVTKFSTEGTIAYSVLIGGESLNAASAIAVDASENAYVLGTTNSSKFPVTPGVLTSEIAAGASTGFLVKLSAGASLLYGTYLGEPDVFGEAILVNADEQPMIAGTGPAPGLPAAPRGTVPEFLIKLNATASSVAAATYIQGANGSAGGMALGKDGQGNVIVSGAADVASFPTSPGAYVSAQPVSNCNADANSFTPLGIGAYVVKLRAADLQPIYASLLNAPCGVRTGTIVVDSSGAVYLGLASGAGLPLRTPLLAAPDCSYNSSAIAQLSPDGSSLEFATYLDNCGVPAIALGNGESLYAGVSPAAVNGRIGVLRITARSVPAISLDQISNAFSGDASAVVSGGLYSISVSGLAGPSINLGLAPTQALPTQLGGLEVKFDGVPAAILAIEPGRAIVAAPANATTELAGQSGAARGGHTHSPVFTSVQAFYNGLASNGVWMPVSTYFPGLLTRDFPELAAHADFADGYVLNEDGTLNDVDHPAAAGSTITVFATGLGATDPPVNPGAVADSHGVMPVKAVYSSWQSFSILDTPTGEMASSSPGFIFAVIQVSVQVPDSIENLGKDVGNGVHRAPLELMAGAPILRAVPPLSNDVAVYVK